MKSMQELCLMPAACAECEKLFDISEDIKRERWMTEKEVLTKHKVLLCWNCRLIKRYIER